MKKDRNAFFQNQSSSSYFYPTAPNVPMGAGPNMGGYPMATESSSNFYQGPVLTPSYPSGGDTLASELESRLAKIERSINRLDTRVSKLESELSTNIGGSSEYVTNNYMV